MQLCKRRGNKLLAGQTESLKDPTLHRHGVTASKQSSRITVIRYR
jgi:hypothetical protein